MIQLRRVLFFGRDFWGSTCRQALRLSSPARLPATNAAADQWLANMPSELS